MFQKLKNSRSAVNAGWLIGGRLINKLIAFVVGILAARYLGPGNYGLINYAMAYTTFFASLCTLGINSVIVKNFIDYPDEEGATIGSALVLRAVSSFLSAIMILGVVAIVDRGEPLTLVVAALCSVGLLFQIFDTLYYWFQARLQSKYAAIASMIAFLVTSGYKLLLLALGKSVEWFALASSLDYTVSGALLLIVYYRKGGSRLSFSMPKAQQLLRSSCSFIVAGLMVSIYASTDKLMLKQMLGENMVGFYSLAASISVSWAFVLSAVIDSLYPGIVQSHSRDYAQYLRKNKQLYAVVFYVSAFISVIICVVAEPFVSILYGEEFLPAVQPLRIVVWYTAFSYLGVARNAWIVCENRQAYLKYLYVGAAVLNIILNLVFIPPLGASGAAIASLATQISTTVGLPYLIRPLRGNARLMMDAIVLKDVFQKQKEETTQ